MGKGLPTTVLLCFFLKKKIQKKLSEHLKKVCRAEYKAIVKGTRSPRTWAEKLQVFPSATSFLAYAKNRYRDVLADEHTRVKLVGMEHDYINANYVEGSLLPGQPKCRYIATQAPLPATMEGERRILCFHLIHFFFFIIICLQTFGG